MPAPMQTAYPIPMQYQYQLAPQGYPTSGEKSTTCEKKETTLSKSSSSQSQQTCQIKMMTEPVDIARGHTSMPAPMQTAYPIPMQYQYQLAPQGYPTSGGPTHQTAMQWSYLQPIPINLLPPGTIPIPVQDLSKSLAEGTPICPVTIAEQFAQMSVANATWGAVAPATVPMAIPIANPAAFQSAPVDPSQEPHEANAPAVPPMAAQEDMKQKSEESDTMKKGSDVKKRQKARKEADEERKHKEEERLKEQKTLEEALERAKREAEITRKARVFKHVLEGADKSPELERRLLGVDSARWREDLQRYFHISYFIKICSSHGYSLRLRVDKLRSEERQVFRCLSGLA
ncbi:hypothetical protein COOONC_05645 [Cooperia oncophora]